MSVTGYRLQFSPLPLELKSGFDFVLPNDLNEFVKYIHNSPRVSGPPLNYNARARIEEAETIFLIHAAEALKNAPRIPPAMSCKSHIVDVLRSWVKNSLSVSELTKAQFKTEFMAYRLGITSDNLNASIGLAHFVEKDFTYNTLAFYKHELRVTSPISPVQILMKGEYVDWEEAKTVACDEPNVDGLWPWKYGPQGIQNKDLAVWSRHDYEERAFTHKKHPSPGKYVFSFCVHIYDKKPKCVGSHSWVRFTTPDGKIYEFALYRPPNTWSPSTALVRKPATIQCPDYSSWYPVSVTERTVRRKLHFEVSKVAFERGLSYIFALQDRRENLTFAMMHGNCVAFTMNVAFECGININPRASTIKLLMPPAVIRTADRVQDFVPDIFILMLYFIPAVLTNIVLAKFLGGAQPGCGEKAHYDTVGDYLNPEKSMLGHPWYLVHQIKARVESSRPPGEPLGIPYAFRAPPRIEDLD